MNAGGYEDVTEYLEELAESDEVEELNPDEDLTWENVNPDMGIVDYE